jgi:hypothetical protein
MEPPAEAGPDLISSVEIFGSLREVDDTIHFQTVSQDIPLILIRPLRGSVVCRRMAQEVVASCE